MNIIKKLLAEKNGNYFYPFFWQHGESDEILKTYMQKISDSGMKGVCIEARPHPDFAGPGWWEDLEVIIEEAKRLSMQLWILDDSHFPTGFANGLIRDRYPQYRKRYLNMRRYDVAGPLPKARIDLSRLGNIRTAASAGNEEILGIYMAQRVSEYDRPGDPVLESSITDITKQLSDRLLTLDIPVGSHSIFIVYETDQGEEEHTKDYLNPLVKEATEVLIEAVYEPHFAHLGSEFGKTITGFFSDEPRFGNKKGWDCAIGTDMPLPWRSGLEKELSFDLKYLPFLWAAAEGVEREVRVSYMDLITRLYSENFTGVLSGWCQEHGVFYLGHTIEDNGAHTRLGYGTGHYFRGQKGQHFAGIDVIGGQIVPGLPHHHDAFSTGGSYGEFYHYTLAKLASSAAHLDPVKKGRAVCEAYGAYGWNEGLKMMKWITDHLIVRGINYLIPHAFSPKQYPDFDCPPHLYAHGQNPQYRYLKVLTAYANRLMELTQGALHRPVTGLLYPAEQEWAGNAMPMDRLTRLLTENQLEFDIISADFLADLTIGDGYYEINGVRFLALLIPWAESIPAVTGTVIEALREAGIPVIMPDQLPLRIIGDARPLPLGLQAVPMAEIPALLKQYRPFSLSHDCPNLVFGDYQQEEQRIWMFFNESLHETIEVQVTAADTQFLYQYDPLINQLCRLPSPVSSPKLLLAPYESIVWILTDTAIEEAVDRPAPLSGLTPTVLAGDWQIRFADSLSYPEFTTAVSMKKPGLLSSLPGFENRTGTASFETDIFIEDNGGPIWIDLGSVYETAEVFVNGASAGVRICGPYTFSLTGLIQKGHNKLRIEVTNTLGTANRDGISHYLPIEPFGICGDIILYC